MLCTELCYVTGFGSTSAMQGAGQSSTINLRIPVWASSSGAKASINAQDLPVPAPSVNLNYHHFYSFFFKFIHCLAYSFFVPY